MKRNLLAAAAFAVALTAGLASPSVLKAEESTNCYCVGGCEGLKNYNPCDGGLCSWFCNVVDE